ncbi:MAG: peptidase M6 [Gaiellaceae bacterium]
MIAVAVAALALALPAAALADAKDGKGDRGGRGTHGVKLEKPKSKRDFPVVVPAQTKAAVAAAEAEQSPPVGTHQIWPVIDFAAGEAAPELFTLRAVGEKIEVWVADDLSFPGADCRNDGSRDVVTDAQARYLADQFDLNIYPKMSASFSTPPPRDGSNAFLEQIGAFPPGYFAGAGGKVVTLVANLRDPNFFDIESPNYIAGYHDPTINLFVDRHVMSIDSYDWLHRTGANPPHEPSSVTCENRPGQPFRYEGVFAHEYQHLLEFWASPGESLWLDEGLADYAVTVAGYGFPARSIFEQGWDGHVQTFLGWRALLTPANQNPDPHGGPENSLTLWGDQGPADILADYGAAWTFMEFLAGRYGTAFMSDLHNEDLKGLKGLQAVLDKYLTGDRAQDVIHDWAAMIALDGAIDDGARLQGKPKERSYQTPALDASVNWDNPESYSSPGAPPNGSDYVRLRDASGRYLSASQMSSLEFSGVERFVPLPVEWQVELEGGDSVLASGFGDGLDRSIQRAVTVPASGDRSLAFESKYEIEFGWDFGVVQVSTDDGRTWTSLANAGTTSEHDPAAFAAIEDQLPGFTGRAGWQVETFDLSAYAGKAVLLRFRMLTDAAGLGNGALPGWWIDDVRVGGALVSDGTLAGWSEVSPFVSGYTVQLVSLETKKDRQTTLARLPLRDGRAVSLRAKELKHLLGKDAGTVAAIVTFDEPSESLGRYAPYSLRVNGVLQPGG